ncbi:MAG TPA: hypothetical protein VN450_05035, partial [Candidatus Methylomirabilis sp.]|nr:hypothetical protein [Candidatus Methylomirabilis sp.]
MSIRAEEITEILKSQIKGYEKRIDVAETGVVLSVGDGIARVHGLEKAMAGELLDFPSDVRGMVLNLEEDNVGVVLLGEDQLIKEGDTVRRTGRIVEVPCGDAMVGRVVNALGQPVDGRGPVETKDFRRVEIKAPGIVKRQPVKEPLQTGLKAIDAMIGRVVNALGQPVDGRGPVETKDFRRVEIKAPGIVKRQPVKEPLQT